MRVLIPDDVEPRHLAEVRAVSKAIDVVALRIERPTWARALRFGARRSLPYRLRWPIRSALDARERLSAGERGTPLRSTRGLEALLATWALGARAVRAVVDALPDLRWVHSTSAGVDRFDLDQLQARRIALTGPRGVHASRVAEFVMALVYADAKRLEDHRRSPLRHVASTELGDLMIGILGYGASGRAVARLARANGMRAQAWVREAGRAARVDGVATSADLREVLATSDVVVVALPLTPDTRGILDADALRAMRSTALLVNVGRSATIVERDLVRALRGGTIRRACLDVIDDEDDVPPDHPLLRTRNVLYTAHSAATSPRSGDEVFAGFVENLRRYCEGRPLLGAFDLDRRGGSPARGISG